MAFQAPESPSMYMMTNAIPPTPQRPLPGGFAVTPAPNRMAQTGAPVAPRPLFRQGSQANMQNALARPAAQQQGQVAAPQQQAPVAAPSPRAPDLTTLQRGAKTINEVLAQDANFPGLESYITQGKSADYELPTGVAWQPFQKVKQYEIPERIFEHYNNAQVSTLLGLFAELNLAWITIDNALYMWDYTHPNPELIGFDESTSSITAVHLAIPKPGILQPQIKYLLVIATTTDILTVGLAHDPSAGAVQPFTLYQTKFHISVRGINVSHIASSRKTGRIFFGGRGSDDVYEFTYQQQEGWFSSRCARVNHTSPKGVKAVLPMVPFYGDKESQHINQIVIDDTRDILYTLSSRSTIRVFHMKQQDSLELLITRKFEQVMQNISHMVQSELLTKATTIVALTPISATESSRLNLVAVTSTGCRIFLSATSGGYYGGSSSNTPTDMQVHHVKFPPPASNQPAPQQQNPGSQMAPYAQAQQTNTSSKALISTRTSARFAPGYSFFFIQKTHQPGNDHLFVSTPDSGRLARPSENAQGIRYIESATWISLGARVEAIDLTTQPFAASNNPQGFGNELAVQYDSDTCEFAILTNTGVQLIRRRRLVDVFAAAVRPNQAAEEGVDGEVRNFIRLYGRGETTATALAVACGQGSEVTPDSRVTKVEDPEVKEQARKVFIEMGGKPTFNENMMVDQNANPIDSVRPSPRHEGIARYVARFVRTIWRLAIVRETVTPVGGLVVSPTVQTEKLTTIQHNLTKLQEFLSANKNSIEGLSGPEGGNRHGPKQDEIALQGEHRALYSMSKLISNIIEGISFVLTLLSERPDEILLSLSPESRQRVGQLTYEALFCEESGKELAKELVKAIVNRNIANGSNVETIAESLQRRCGSFCSAQDVVIFKAQEHIKRAYDAGAQSEMGRKLLNDSQKQFQSVASSLGMEQLHKAIQQYIEMQFFAGAIELALTVAQESDRGNQALGWLRDGAHAQDPRKRYFDSRQRCYDLIHGVIQAVDQAAAQAPEMVEGQYTAIAKRKAETYDAINRSDDEVFQTDLYDWYMAQGWSDRLLDIQSPYVVTYLTRKAQEDVAHADLLWRYHAHYNNFFEAARVQYDLAKSQFNVSLEQRMEYLSRARANASTRPTGVEYGMSRQPRQQLLREISDLLEVASIQADILQRLKGDARLTGQRRAEVLPNLSNQILDLTTLYNTYADSAQYWDICLTIYAAADHRNPADIMKTWEYLLDQTTQEALAQQNMQPYEAVAERVRTIGTRLNLSEAIFPVQLLLPLLLKWSLQHARTAPRHWIPSLLLDLNTPYETILPILESLFYNDEAPFTGRNKRVIASDLLYVISMWFEASRGLAGLGGQGQLFGGEENALAVGEMLGVLGGSGLLEDEEREQAEGLRARVDAALR